MQPDILIDREELNRMLLISEASRKRLAKTNPAFPAPVKLGIRKIAYRRQDVLAFIERRQAA